KRPSYIWVQDYHRSELSAIKRFDFHSDRDKSFHIFSSRFIIY
uniref:Uncharacterized protein n=1 Tax=Anopheles albimanus TaxID=7167 RepID=A0A182FYK5_ANOAL